MHEKNNISLVTKEKKNKQLLLTIINSFSYLTHAIIHNNKIGNLTYSLLIIIEHVIIALLLLSVSYPV